MSIQTLDPIAIRKLRLEALAKALGPIGMVRFKSPLHFNFKLLPETSTCLRPSARASDNIQSGYLIDWYFKISCEMLLFMKLYNKKDWRHS